MVRWLVVFNVPYIQRGHLETAPPFTVKPVKLDKYTVPTGN